MHVSRFCDGSQSWSDAHYEIAIRVTSRFARDRIYPQGVSVVMIEIDAGNDRKGLATGGRCSQIHLYLIFSCRIVKLKIKVIVFAAIIGGSSVNRPFTNQKKTPVVKVIYMASEISQVCLVRIIRTAWGKNAIVVNVAAIKPKAVDSFTLASCPLF
jgi:hypothetical protein